MSAFGIIDYVASGGSLFTRGSYAASLTSAGQWFSSYLVMAVPFAWLFFQEREERYADVVHGRLLRPQHCGFVLISYTGRMVAVFAQLTVVGLLRAPHKWQRWAIAVGLCLILILVGGSLFMGFQDVLIHNVSETLF